MCSFQVWRRRNARQNIRGGGFLGLCQRAQWLATLLGTGKPADSRRVSRVRRLHADRKQWFRRHLRFCAARREDRNEIAGGAASGITATTERGPLFGGQVGYNYQLANVPLIGHAVVGIEADSD